MSLTSPIAFVLGIGWLCLIAQLVAALGFARRPLPAAARSAGVSVLKPLHGDEPGLYENLRSFVEQDCPAVQLGVQPAVQIVLGVNHSEDGALDAARALIRDFPKDDIALVIDRRIRGSNQKVANLENMLMAAHHDILVLADSDMRVDPHYLAGVTEPLEDERVGAVTCLYKGVSTGGLWSDLGALQINFGFLPNALLGDALAIGGGCFGATIALRRATLGRIGGFARVRDELADDQRIGDAVRAQGLAVVLSPYLVEARVWEPSLVALWRHELRWARTVRGIAPLGFAGSAATHPLAIALFAAGIAGSGSAAGVLLAATCLLRWTIAGVMARALGLSARKLWLLPLRDLLSFAVFVASFFGRRVSWRDQNLYVEPNGRMTVVDGG
jgi:ceramide glucosyltransferase